MKVPPGRAISVRLDPYAAAALRTLEQAGMTRSEAVRHALTVVARLREERTALARVAAQLAADEEDRREKAGISAALDEIRQRW